MAVFRNEDTGFDMSSAMGDYAIDDEHIVDFVKSWVILIFA